ncbi:MAG: hypothetical protein SFV23_19080 [Planctomycetaceae bacterium]|nr:hypothetical protein [Planctomycetaceae bacterium]
MRNGFDSVAPRESLQGLRDAVWLSVSSGLVLLAAGCGGAAKFPVYPAQGTLTLDGEPNGPASFLLLPTEVDKKNPKPSVAGTVDAAGKISLSCYANGDGAPEGDYNVQFTPNVAGGAAAKPIPPFYGRPSNGLTVKITKTTGDAVNDVSLQLVSKPKSGNAAAAATGGPSVLPQKSYPAIDPALMPKSSR